MKATEAAALTASVTGPDSLAPSTASSNVQVGRLYAGQLAQLSVTSIDTNDPSAQASDYEATVSWGDGTSSAGVVSGSGGVFTVSAEHTYGAAGLQGPFYSVFVTLSRPNAMVTVSDVVGVVPPRLTWQAAEVWTDAAGLAAGVTLGYFEVASTSIGASQFAASVDWGDGSMASSATVQAVVPGLFRVVASHGYENAGWHLPTVTVSRLSVGVETPALRFGDSLLVYAAPLAKHRLENALNTMRQETLTLDQRFRVRVQLRRLALSIEKGVEARLSVSETKALLEIAARFVALERPQQDDKNVIVLTSQVKMLLPYADPAGFAAYLRKPASTKTMVDKVQAKVTKAIADLGDDDFDTRVSAEATLRELGDTKPIMPQVFDELDSPNLEVRRRAPRLVRLMYADDEARMVRVRMTLYERHLMEEVIGKFAAADALAVYQRVAGGGTDYQVSNVARYYVNNGRLPNHRVPHMDVGWDDVP